MAMSKEQLYDENADLKHQIAIGNEQLTRAVKLAEQNNIKYNTEVGQTTKLRRQLDSFNVDLAQVRRMNSGLSDRIKDVTERYIARNTRANELENMVDSRDRQIAAQVSIIETLKKENTKLEKEINVRNYAELMNKNREKLDNMVATHYGFPPRPFLKPNIVVEPKSKIRGQTATMFIVDEIEPKNSDVGWLEKQVVDLTEENDALELQVAELTRKLSKIKKVIKS